MLSMDQFQLTGNKELCSANLSMLGLNMGPFILSNIGAANDVALLSSDPHSLQYVSLVIQEVVHADGTL